MTLRPLFTLTMVTFVLALPMPLLGQVNSTWNGTAGNWTDATRWSTNPVFPHNGQPNAGDLYNAIINAGTVTLDQNIVIQSLTFTGVTITGAGHLTLNSSSVWSNGTMSGSGTTFVNGAMQVNGFTMDRTLTNNGTITWASGSSAGAGEWKNQNGSMFDIQNDSTLGGTAIFNNQAGATLQKSAGTGQSTIFWPVNNAGAINVNAGTLALIGGGSTTGSGTYSITSGATVLLRNHSLAAGTNVSGSGDVRFNQGGNTVDGGFSILGLTSIEGNALVNFNNTATMGSLQFLGGQLQGSGTVHVNGTTTWTLGTMAGSGNTVFHGSTSLSNFSVDRIVNNSGTATWSGAIGASGAGTWNNLIGSVFDIQNDQVLGGGGTFNNQAGATLRKSVGSGTSTINWGVNNAGTVDVQSGILNFNIRGYTQTSGQLRLNGGSVVSNVPLTFNGGILIGTGSITGSVLLGNVALSPGFSAGTLTLNGNTSMGSGVILDYELGTNSDLIIVNGNIILDGILNVKTLTGFGEGLFTLIDYSGTLTDNGLELGTMPAGFTYQLISDLQNTQIQLQVISAVPEPSVLILGISTITGIGIYSWLRRLKK